MPSWWPNWRVILRNVLRPEQFRGYGLPMTNRWYAYFSLALEGPASN